VRNFHVEQCDAVGSDSVVEEREVVKEKSMYGTAVAAAATTTTITTLTCLLLTSTISDNNTNFCLIFPAAPVLPSPSPFSLGGATDRPTDRSFSIRSPSLVNITSLSFQCPLRYNCSRPMYLQTHTHTHTHSVKGQRRGPGEGVRTKTRVISES